MPKCGKPCEIWTRVCGYFRPVKFFHAGKKEEYRERVDFDAKKAIRTVEELKAHNRNQRQAKSEKVNTEIIQSRKSGPAVLNDIGLQREG